MARLPLSVIAPNDYLSIAADIKKLDPASLLPNGTDATVIAGYTAQLKAMAAGARSNNTAWLQFGLRGLSHMNVNYMHPLSRDSVNINVSDPTNNPVVDYRALTKPIDIRIEVLLLKAARNYFSHPGEIQKLGPVEILPGLNVTTDAQLEKYARDTVTPTQYHPVGTCA
jgi:choline dehydrogenase